MGLLLFRDAKIIGFTEDENYSVKNEEGVTFEVLEVDDPKVLAFFATVLVEPVQEPTVRDILEAMPDAISPEMDELKTRVRRL